MSSLTRVMTLTTCHTLQLQVTYAVTNNISHYDDELHIMSISYILRTEDMLQNTLCVSTLHHNHSKLSGHMNQFQAMDA